MGVTSSQPHNQRPSSRRKLDEFQVRDLVKLYVTQRMSVEDAGRRMGVSAGTAAAYLRDAGVELDAPGGRLRHPDRVARARELRRAGMSPGDIRRELGGISPGTLHSWLDAES